MGLRTGRRNREGAELRPYRWILAGLAICTAAVLSDTARAETLALDRIDHIHGIAVDPERREQLYLATHSGVFLAAPDGTAQRVGSTRDDLMSFVADPGDPGTFLASGHPAVGGNLGVMVSHDRGVSWEHLSDGAGGPVDFHALTVSPADPQTVYGMYRGLQRSRDGGHTWRVVGALPEDTFDLAASALGPDRLYAAARGGLFRSVDGGASWSPVFEGKMPPATLVHVAADGVVSAFLYGTGLIVSSIDEERWELRAEGFADRYLLQLADDPEYPNLLYAVPDTGAVLISRDGGRGWASYAGHLRETPERIAAGARLFDRLCQSCHGKNGIGERPGAPGATDEYGYVAPALDDTAHAWHHSDDNLVQTILKGSPRNPRMLGFGEFLTEEEARDVVAYLKSLWSFRSLACQGARHMRCMR